MEAAILFVLGCLVIFIGFRVFLFYKKNQKKIDKIMPIAIGSIAGLVLLVMIYNNILSYSEKRSVLDFFYNLFLLAFWVIGIVSAFFLSKKYLSQKKKEQLEYQQHIATIKHQKEREKQREQEYQGKIEQLEFIRKKNQLISEDIPEIKRFVSQLSIYDENFLEQQPALLQYIEKLIKEGKA